MDELFERIKILEEENKLLEKEYQNLDNELNQKKAEMSARNFLTEKEQADFEKKKFHFSRKV